MTSIIQVLDSHRRGVLAAEGIKRVLKDPRTVSEATTWDEWVAEGIVTADEATWMQWMLESSGWKPVPGPRRASTMPGWHDPASWRNPKHRGYYILHGMIEKEWGHLR